MCQPASFIVTKTAVLFDENGDSHDKIIKDHDLKDDGVVVRLVRVEIVPPGGDYSKPLKDWAFRLDQDMLPDWWDAADAEARCRKALPKWAKHHIVKRGTGSCAEDQTRIFLGDAKCQSVTGGEAWFCGSSTCQSITGGVARFIDSSTCRSVTGGDARFYSSSTCQSVTGGWAQFCDSSTCRSVTGGDAWFCDSSTCRSVTGGNVRFYGSSSCQSVTGGKAWFCDSSTCQSVTGGIARFYGSSSCQSITGGVAWFCDSSKDPRKERD